MKNLLFFCIFLVFINCTMFQPTTFTQSSMDEKFQTLEKEEISFKEILEKNRGKKALIQFFTNYCPISQESFEEVVKLQKVYPHINYVFLSVDHTYHDWKRGLEYVKAKGQFYYLPKKGKGQLGAFLKLKTIPRFLILDSNGEIEVFKSSKLSKRILNKLQK